MMAWQMHQPDPMAMADICTPSVTGSSKPIRTALKQTSRAMPKERPRWRPRTPSVLKFCTKQSNPALVHSLRPGGCCVVVKL